jgi:hypothetical protein
MDDVVVMDSHGPSRSVWLYQLTVCGENKAASLVFFI